MRRMSINYAWEKLYLAVSGMAHSEESLQDRLAAAYMFNVMKLKSEDLPPDVQDKFENLGATITSKQGPKGTVLATTAIMSDEEAKKWIDEIVSMYDAVTREYARSLADRQTSHVRRT